MAVVHCLDCGTLTSNASRCAVCRARREVPVKRASGRSTSAWQKLREQRKRLDGYRCTYCGSTRDLTVDLHPRLRGDHRAATLADCRTACRSCNSRRGGRA